MLCAPVVDSPITPCTRKVRVRGALTGATVRLFQNGAPVGSGTASGPTDFIPLDASVTLVAGRRITATQQMQGQQPSPATPAHDAAVVLKTPTSNQLGQIYSRARLLECGICLWLEGIVPGATVSVQIGNDPPVVVTADWTAVHVDLPSPLATNVPVRAQQTACGVAGPTVTLPPTLGQSPQTGPLPSPTIDAPLGLCQRALTVHPLAGAEITLEHGDELTEFCFGATTGTFWLSRGLELQDRVRISQAFDNCELQSATAEYAPTEAVPPAPAFPFDVCVTDTSVEISGLKEGAHVQFFRDAEPAPFATADAGTAPHRFNLPPLNAATRLGVRQTLCDFGPWSDITFTDLVAAGAPESPVIIEPVHGCGAAVGVTGLRSGTRVRVASQIWGGPIGESISTGDEIVDVPVWFNLGVGDKLNLETIRCGEFQGHSTLTEVEPAPDLLPEPELDNPLDDCGGRIPVRHVVPGAIVDIERVPDPMFPVDTSGVLLTSAPASTHRSRVKVPALQPKWLIRARQRLCSKVSRPSDVVKAGDRPPKYDNVHRTFRICQLTGASDPAGQPHPFDTTVVDLVGTDLGIPVDTGARLYFFFGDSPETDDSAGDGDPIAWTASGPEPNGPTLHWLVNEEGLYRRLTVEGIPTLENFEVPTGGFTYGGRIYLFIAREKVDGVMKTSHLAVSKLPHNDPNQNLQELYKVATCLDDGSNAPAGAWLVHVSPVVVHNADWPGLPQSSGEGLLMFGSKNYMASNVYLAWAPLTPGQHPPHPSTWRYFKENHPGQWIAAATVPAGQEPTKLLIIPDPGPVAELSVIWQRRMRRWIMAHMQPGPNTAQAVVRTSRFPWGPWSAPVVVFDGVNDQLQAAADNLPGNKLVGHPHADATQNRNTVPYAPYLIARWSKFDPSTGRLTLYYTLSVEDPPYSPQLMRTHLICD